MKAYLAAEKQDILRRRRERLIIASLLVIVSTLTTYLGIQAFDLGLDLPLANSLFIFALININVILLLLLLFLTMRNLVKLLLERKKKMINKVSAWRYIKTDNTDRLNAIRSKSLTNTEKKEKATKAARNFHVHKNSPVKTADDKF